MDARGVDLAVVSGALCGLGHLAFAVLLWRAGYLRRDRDSTERLVLIAILATAAWAFAAVAEQVSRYTGPSFLAAGLDVLRYAIWLLTLLALLRQPGNAPVGGSGSATLSTMGRAVYGLVAGAVLVLGWRLVVGHYAEDSTRVGLAISLALPLLGLVLVEQLFRNLHEDSRWAVKPVCVGLAAVFAFDVYMYSEAVLFGRVDQDAKSIRAGIHLLALPFLLVAVRRRADWVRSIQVSRRVAFYSATLLLTGAYLLFIAAIGYYVRYFGGNWGRALQLGLIFAGGLSVLILVLSASLRARVRIFVGKHFFSYRFDYREEWLAFTEMLSSSSAPQEVGVRVVRALANVLESPAGSLWSSQTDDAAFTQAARWNVAQADDREPGDSVFCRFLAERGWVIDLQEFRESPRRYGELALPMWLLSNPQAWAVIPLQVGQDLLGFVVLHHPRTPVELNWEVRDLLKTAGRQAAGYLAQMRATEALLEARKFDAFNRMSAFVVHDLKNIVTQLSLMLRNAQRLHDNPEFQQDMLLTVESSLEKMRRLMLQLREGAVPTGAAHGVELRAIVGRLERIAASAGRRIEVDVAEDLSTRGHEERIERVLGHLVQNAMDATAPQGRVWLVVRRYGGQVQVTVGDDGKGMSEEFVRTRLFKPFSSTKSTGMGIGSYESAQYVKEIGGSIAVDSEVGRGTLVTVLLPLFDSQRSSDLRMPEST